MIETKPLPNNKRQLLDGNNYEMYNLDLMRKVFPRIFTEHNEAHRTRVKKPQIRDIIALYFYLLSYVDGRHTLEDGSTSVRFGASFPPKSQMCQALGIAESRIKPLVDILETNGLISETRDIWVGTRRYKWYFMSFCPQISDDGYVVDENGERIMPDKSLYK